MWRRPRSSGMRHDARANARRVRICYRMPTLEDDLLQPLGVKPEFLGHLDQLLRGLRIPDGMGQTLGSVGLVAVVIGLGHVSTFSDEYEWRAKGSIMTRGAADRAGTSRITAVRKGRLGGAIAAARLCESNPILIGGTTRKPA